jgi:hypothetical protein
MSAQPSLVNNGWLTIPWAMVNAGPAGSDGVDGALGHVAGGNQASFAIQVNYGDVQQAIQDLCGVYVRDPSTGYLSRTQPRQHPHPAFEHLRVSRIAGIRPMAAIGKQATKVGAWTQYHYWIISVGFAHPRARMLDDATLDRLFPPVTATDGNRYRQEWMRNVEWTPTSSVEVISREGNTSWKYQETSATGPAVNDKFPSPQGQFLGKQDWVAVWRNVPMYRALLSSAAATIDRPINLDYALYTLNDAPFRGNPAGTLMFRGYKWDWNESPYGPQIANLLSTDVALTGDVSLAFTQFDPPAGTATSTVPGPNYNSGATSRGHNLAPYVDNLWYLIKDAKTGTQTIFKTSPFERIFSLPG